MARAERELSQLGYRTFCPRLRKWVSHARVKRAVERPLLGRYLFVEIPRDEGTEAARSANGVEGFVSVGGRPVTLPPGCVEDLMRRQFRGEWNFVDPDINFPDGKGGIRVNDKMPVGARVRIVEGPFEEMLATLINRKHGRLQCKLLGENRYVRLFESNIRAAG